MGDNSQLSFFQERVAIPGRVLDGEPMEIMQLTPAQLRKAAVLKERIEELQQELESVLGVSAAAAASKKLHWTQTPAGQAKLKRSARLAWRTRRRASKPTAAPSSGNGKTPHWTQTPAGRAKMAKLMQRQWQKRRSAATAR